jgi:hypothetical protein
MKVASMRSRAALPKDRVDVEEMTPIVDSRAAGDRNRHAGALIVRAQHARVAADKPIFHRIDEFVCLVSINSRTCRRASFPFSTGTAYSSSWKPEVQVLSGTPFKPLILLAFYTFCPKAGIARKGTKRRQNPTKCTKTPTGSPTEVPG